MPHYVILGRLTFKALDAIKNVKERDSKAEQIIKAAGGKILASYYTFGRYDFIVVIEMPSNDALIKVLLEIGKWGTVSTETLTALTPEQVYKAATGM